MKHLRALTHAGLLIAGFGCILYIAHLDRPSHIVTMALVSFALFTLASKVKMD